jgi:serine/threonine protein kinase
MPLSTGLVLNNRYRIVKLLGQGGFGAVYRAWDLNLNAPCALKESLTTSPESIKQFSLEARLLANLRHINLPAVIDHFIVEGQGQYLVMDYVEGEDLQQMLKRINGPLPEGQVLAWISQVCDTLTYLHSQNPPVIHRDIKPANIKITPQGQVKLVDFGIAKEYRPSQKTTKGARAVTPGYSPPEQYGKGLTDPRTDIYAVGATLYTVLTCQAPVESLELELGHQLPGPRQLNPSISPATETAILKSLQLAPEHRFQTAVELKAALCMSNPLTQVATTQVVQPFEQAISPPLVHPALKRRRKNGALIAGVVLAVGVVCILGIGLALLGSGLIFGKNSASGDGSGNMATRTRHPTTTLIGEVPTPIPITPTSGIVIQPTFTPLPSATPVPTFPPTHTRIPTSTVADTPTDLGIWEPCPGIYPSRLHVGMHATVSFHPAKSNNVRRRPDISAPLVGQIDPGEEIEITGGPVCQNGYIWWQIISVSTHLSGWTAEGDNSNYWLVPAQ